MFVNKVCAKISLNPNLTFNNKGAMVLKYSKKCDIIKKRGDKMSKKKSNMKNLGAHLILILIGALCGVIMVVYLDGIFEEYGFFLSLLFKLLIFLVTYYVQLIIHEAGHLVAGLLTGYSFGSFRAGSIIIVKENGKLKIKKQTIAENSVAKNINILPCCPLYFSCWVRCTIEHPEFPNNEHKT